MRGVQKMSTVFRRFKRVGEDSNAINFFVVVRGISLKKKARGREQLWRKIPSEYSNFCLEKVVLFPS